MAKAREKRAKEFTRVQECLWRHNASGVHYAIMKVGGRQIKKSLRTVNLDLARKELFRLRSTFLGRDTLERGVTFTELALSYVQLLVNDVENRRAQAMTLAKHFDPMKTTLAADLTLAKVLTYRAKRLKQISARTVNYEMDTLKSILDHGVNVVRCLLDNVASGIKKQKHEVKKSETPGSQEFRRIIEEMRMEPKSAVVGGAADMCELLAYTGIRRGAIPFLTWDKIDLEKGRITLRNEKVGKWYQVPIYPALREFLIRLKSRNPGAKLSDRLVVINDCKNSLIGACRRAGLPKFGHHALRHFFATNAVAAGVDFATVARWLNHSDGGALAARVYSHVREDHSDELARKMTVSAI